MIPLDDRLTTFGNQLIDSHIRLRELLAALRDGTYTELSRDHQQIEEVLDRLKDLSTIDNTQEPVQVRGQPQPWGELSRSKQHARSSAP